MVLQSYFELRRMKETNPVLKQFEQDYPSAVTVAEELYRERVLDQIVDGKISYETIFQKLCRTIDKVQADT
jgi:hypothetical protein